MAQKRYVYGTSVTWDGGARGVCSAPGRPDLHVAPPAEFGGPGDAWSPEELLVASVNACAMATFLYYAGRSGVDLIRYRSDAQGTVEPGAQGLAFTSLTVRSSVTVAAGHLAEAREAMDRARRCLVSNSLAVEVRVEADVAEAAV
jgi:organic hydroperoxide reductase OsmC/OhrA